MARCIAKPVHSPFAPWCSPVAVPRGRAPCCAPSLPCPIVWSRYRAPWSCPVAVGRDVPIAPHGPVIRSRRAVPLRSLIARPRCRVPLCSPVAVGRDVPIAPPRHRRGAWFAPRAPTHVVWQVAHAESFAGGVSVRPLPPAGAPGPRRARRLSSLITSPPARPARSRPARSRPRAAPTGNNTAPKNHLPFSPKSNILQTTFVNFPR